MRIAPMVVTVLLLAASVAGGWQPSDGHKMHFPQEPDLYSTTGMDVCDVAPMRLADDFQCSETGLITDIHVWVSWKNDEDTALAGAEIALRSDAGSVPGGLLWSRSFTGAEIASSGWAINPDGLWWYDPATGDSAEADHTAISLLNFFIEPEDAYRQTQGEYYWLEVSLSLAEGATEQVGWSTTRDTYADGAVWWDDGAASWQRLSYPSGHPWDGQTMDLAFVITPEPATLAVLAACAAASLLRRRRRSA
jgi:hypothetical protein